MTEIPCKHWRNCGVSWGGCCALGAFDRPPFGTCLYVCPHYDGPARGRGDLIKAVVSTVTLGLVQPCGKYQERQQSQNAAHPAKWVEEALHA